VVTTLDAELPGDETLDLGAAAEHLGVSPTVLAQLMDRGTLPWRTTPDVRVRRVALRDLEQHRDQRFALRQDLARKQRAQRVNAWVDDWADPDVPVD
jgi:hypothetical protein